MIIAMLGVDDINRLLASSHPFDQEGIHDRLLLRGPHGESAGMEMMSKLRLSQGGGD